MNTTIISGLSNIIVGFVTIALCIPLLKDKIAMNRWYGIRLKQSFESSENWYRINRYGAQRMILWSVIIVIIGILTLFVPINSKEIRQILISCALVLLVIPTVESWLFAKKL
jgi:hypothetical protein